jgi:large subunit ribosomal protein L24
MAMHVKKGDMVQVISGDSKGVTAKVLRVIPEKNRVVVEGVNLAFKHVRPSQKSPQGGRIRIEKPIHLSNVLPVSPKSGKGVRVRFETDGKGNKKRIGSDHSEIGVVTRAIKKK